MAIIVFRNDGGISAMNEDSFNSIREIADTPAGGILMWAFNMAGETSDKLPQLYPRILQYPNGKDFGNLIQFANIIAALLRIERHFGPHNYTVLHQSVIQSIAPFARPTYVPPLQSLSCCLLQIDKNTLGKEDLPSFNELLNKPEEKLAAGIGEWIILQMKQDVTFDLLDGQLMRVLGGVVYQINAKFVITMMLTKKNIDLIKKYIEGVDIS